VNEFTGGAQIRHFVMAITVLTPLRRCRKHGHARTLDEAKAKFRDT